MLGWFEPWEGICPNYRCDQIKRAEEAHGGQCLSLAPGVNT